MNSKSYRKFSARTVLPFLMLFSIPAMASTSADEKPVAVKEWTFLTYLNGFNNLDSFGTKDLLEMEKVGSSAQVNVVVQWASLANRDVRRMLMQKSTDASRITTPVVENIGRADMGDSRTLVDFVKWASKKYPAKHYFLNIWNHGSGWHFAELPTTKDISYDDLSGHHITTEQLGQATTEIASVLGQKLDVFGADACLMAMGEVAGQMKNSVGHFVGSQEVEPADGWPYDRLLTNWNAGANKTAAEVSSILSQVYLESYGTARRQITLSAMDLSQYDGVTRAIRDLGQAISSQTIAARAKIATIVSGTESYSDSDYKDLGDLIDRLSADTTLSIRPDVLLAAKTALGKFVIENHTSSDYSRSHGVSIWFPDSAYDYNNYRARYQALTFNQDTAWLDAIQTTLHAAGEI